MDMDKDSGSRAKAGPGVGVAGHTVPVALSKPRLIARSPQTETRNDFL